VKINGEDVIKTENWKATTRAYLDEHILLAYLTPDEYFETLRKIYGFSELDLKHHLDKFTELFNDEVLGKKKYIRYLREKSEMISELEAYFTG
jgi:ABC-2 type transport system ATP-binding protein